ncbi:MAG: RNA polymerase sigma-70 factor [bacterium]|nr:RNA polymerase sigma-70 factor [bacterium]
MASDPTDETPALDDATSAFVRARPRLFGIAYRMLGSVPEAEDVVQETWLRWQATDRDVVVHPAAFLATTTTRLAITAAQSARVRREAYLGPWLPEPIDTSADPGLGAERGEALELAVLLLLERLPPLERAAYVLREAFDHSYAQIAETLQVSEANARQLASRARKHLAAERRTHVDVDEQRRLLDAFLVAARAGDMASLVGLFTPEVVSMSDGGGVVRAARRPVAGRDRVAHFLVAISRWLWVDATITPVEANGRAALLIRREGRPYALLAIHTTGPTIDRIFWVMHPDKLAGIARAADLGAAAP